jgi:hypothetical protein
MERLRFAYLFRVCFLICSLTALLLCSSLVRDAAAAPMQAPSTTQYGLEWPGDGAVRRMLHWQNPFPIYDATYIFKVFPRKKTTGDNPRYYTTFFWGNNGPFAWDTTTIPYTLPNTYYGAHPYPVDPPMGPGQWEISVAGQDKTTGTEVEWNRWYTQVFRAWRESADVTWHEFYWDWPDQTKVIVVRVQDPVWGSVNPPNPAIVMGQAPNVGGVSWGGYPGWEEFNGVIRGIQMYSGKLSLDDIKAEIAAPKSSTAGAGSIWYLNLDPRPTDVTDKKGIGTAHNPSWDGTTALEWIRQPPPSEPTEFNINVTTFIPGNKMSAAPLFCIDRSTGKPRVRFLFLKTDDRGFDPAGTTYRTRQLATAIPNDASDADGLKNGSVTLQAQPTKLYAVDASHTIVPSDDDGVLGDCAGLEAVLFPIADDVRVTSTRVGPKHVRVRLRGDVGTGARSATDLGINPICGIGWDITIDIDTSGPTPRITRQGKHDGFPAYEVYVNNQSVYTYSPGPPPYDLRDLLKLCDPLDVTIR